jgi:uncharacterized protein YkwD
MRAMVCCSLPLGFAMLLGISGTQRVHAQEQDDARFIAQLTNQDRQENGLPTLKWNDALAAAAQTHDEQMVRERALSHQFPGEPELAARAARTLPWVRTRSRSSAAGCTPRGIERTSSIPT